MVSTTLWYWGSQGWCIFLLNEELKNPTLKSRDPDPIIDSLTGFISFGFAQVLNPHTDTKVTGVPWRLEIAVDFWALFWVRGRPSKKDQVAKWQRSPKKKESRKKRHGSLQKTRVYSIHLGFFCGTTSKMFHSRHKQNLLPRHFWSFLCPIILTTTTEKRSTSGFPPDPPKKRPREIVRSKLAPLLSQIRTQKIWEHS